VADSRIDNNAVLSLHGDSNSTGFAQLVEISVSSGAIPPVPNWTCRPQPSETLDYSASCVQTPSEWGLTEDHCSLEFRPPTLPSQVWLR
jgi:hypothetical protein